MDDPEALSLLESAAVRLVRGFGRRGSAAFVIRVLDTGEVRLIGLQLPPEAVARMLRMAADGYQDQVAPERAN